MSDVLSRGAQSITFLHTADLHLGAPFRGLRALSDEWSNRMVEALRTAYELLIDEAIASQVDFVLIAGDAFDLAKPTYGDYLCFLSGLHRLKAHHIPVYMVCGNHDSYLVWRDFENELPKNVTLFSAEGPDYACFESKSGARCMIAGRSFWAQAWPQELCVAQGLTRSHAYEALKGGYPYLSEDDFVIGLIHTGLHYDPVKAPVQPEVLLRAGMDYWACGHIHSPLMYPDEEHPRIVYSGCIQGRDIKESGKHGAFVVSLTKGQEPSLRFVPTAQVAWDTLKVRVSSCEQLAQIEEAIVQALYQSNASSQTEYSCVRVELKGASPLHHFLSDKAVLEDMREHLNSHLPCFFIDAIVSYTSLPLNTKTLAKEGLFPAAVLESAKRMNNQTDELINYLQKEFISRGFAPDSLSDKKAEKMIKQAQGELLDVLVTGGRR